MREPIKQTLTFVPSAGDDTRWETLLPVGAGEEQCQYCKEDAEAYLLETYTAIGVWRYEVYRFCRVHMDEHLVTANRTKECEESGAQGERLDQCWEKKAKEEGHWKHQGKEDSE